jgi:cytochrome c-type biogenesis protein
VLTFVAATSSAALGFVYLRVFSLGLTALLVVVGLSSGALASLPRAGRWTQWVKRAGGVLMIGMAEYYLIRMGGVL